MRKTTFANVPVYNLKYEVLFCEIIMYFTCLLISKNVVWRCIRFHIVVKPREGKLLSPVTSWVLSLSMKIAAAKEIRNLEA